MPGLADRGLPHSSQFGSITSDDIPLNLTRLLLSVQMQQALPTFNLDNFGVRDRLSNLPLPLVDQLARTEHKSPIWPTGSVSVDRRHRHHRFPSAHFADQENCLLSEKSLAGC